MKLQRPTASLMIGIFTFALAAGTLLAAEPDKKAWLENWYKQNPQWRALHLMRAPKPDDLPKFERLIAESLKPAGINVLILGITYDFQYQSHPELKCTGMNKKQARELTETCRRCGIRLIPLFECLGHQPIDRGLLKAYPEFDQPMDIPPGDKHKFTHEWCPSNPDVNKVVFGLLDELIDAFDADALHLGMDEVFMMGSKNCPRCNGKNVAELFAGVVNPLHDHLVKEKGVEMLMWGDRLLKSPEYGSRFAASLVGSHPAIDMVPKDIIMCDWHYPMQDDYPSVHFFQEKGFRVLPATYQYRDAALAFIRNSRRDATDRMLGFLFTYWSAGDIGLLEALETEDTDPANYIDDAPGPNKRATSRLMANTIQAGLKELAHPTEAPKPSPNKNKPAEKKQVDGL